MEVVNFSYFVKNTEGLNPTDVQHKDLFDLDFEITQFKNSGLGQELPTSVSLCTPTCGNTGTGNSFCCTCR